ncbi:MAG: hypothetical protein PVG07_16045 [Acidobacteriota bacterium]|jgi:hypothetical protein
MTRTKLTLSLVAVALLLATASVAVAAETETAPDLVETPAVDAPVTPGASCGADGQPLVDLEGQEPIPTTQYCGACSTGGCAGAERGRICWISGLGWQGHCNIFSGGYMCPEGGWECQCEYGPLP